MYRDENVEEVHNNAGKNKTGSVIVGLVILVLFAVMIIVPVMGIHLKNEVSRTGSERAYIGELQAVLKLHEVYDAEIALTEDMDCDPNIRYYNVAIRSAEFEGLSSEEKYKTILELCNVKLKPAEEEVFVVITRPFLLTSEANYRISKSADEAKLLVVKNPPAADR